jgi:hypothetical protein
VHRLHVFVCVCHGQNVVYGWSWSCVPQWESRQFMAPWKIHIWIDDQPQPVSDPPLPGRNQCSANRNGPSPEHGRIWKDRWRALRAWTPKLCLVLWCYSKPFSLARISTLELFWGRVQDRTWFCLLRFCFPSPSAPSRV